MPAPQWVQRGTLSQRERSATRARIRLAQALGVVILTCLQGQCLVLSCLPVVGVTQSTMAFKDGVNPPIRYRSLSAAQPEEQLVGLCYLTYHYALSIIRVIMIILCYIRFGHRFP